MTHGQPTHDLGQPTDSGGKMLNFRRADSTAAADGSISVNVHTRASRTKRAARRLRATLALATLSVALFLLPGQAFAGDPCSDATTAQYANQQQQCLAAGLGSGQGGGGPAERVAVPAAASGPTLPFTGLDVAALAAVAIALAGTGVVLRRLASMGDSEQ
jgi:hypothetical protein